MNKTALAFYFPSWDSEENRKDYTKEDLINPKTVEELFDYCQILYADITREGWDFLIEHYGFEKLWEIDKKSGWLTDWGESLHEYVQWVEYMRNTNPE